MWFVLLSVGVQLGPFGKTGWAGAQRVEMASGQRGDRAEVGSFGKLAFAGLAGGGSGVGLAGDLYTPGRDRVTER